MRGERADLYAPALRPDRNVLPLGSMIAVFDRAEPGSGEH
jgi:hypothetical protein